MLTGTSCKKNMPVVLFDTDDMDTTIQHASPAYPDSTIDFLALGDSYTIGASVDERDRFPAQTKGILGKNNIHLGALRYIAVSGWTSSSLLSALTFENLPDSFKIVTLLIGVNDQYRGYGLTGYNKQFTQLLDKSIVLAGGRRDHVFVLSIPD